MKKVGNWLWGGVLIALGVILGLNALQLTNIDLFFPGWWTLFLIVPCAIGLFTDRDKTGNIIGLIIGVALLLGCLDVVSFGMMWKLVLPLILVGIGISLIVKNSSNARVSEKIRQAERRQKSQHAHVAEGEVVGEDGETKNEWMSREEYWTTFSDQNINYDGKEFTGCKIDAVFGGAELDLRKAKIQNEAVVKTSSVFAGVVIYVPKDVKVEIVSTALFGGVADKRAQKVGQKEAKTTLYIEANCIFGGLELR